MIKERIYTIIYRAYVTAVVFFILGFYIGFIPVDLGNNILKLKEGNLVPFNPEFIKLTQQIVAAHIIFSTAISALGALVSIGTRNVFEILALFWVGMLPKENRHWGVVFDQRTNQPISFVPVRLFKEKGDQKELLFQTVSDTDGRYRLHLNEVKADERYVIEIYYPGYETLAQDVNQYLVLGNYDLIHDIPLVQSKSAISSIKKALYFYRPRLFKYLFLTIFFSYVLVWIFNTFLLVNSPIFLNLFSVIVITITLAWNIEVFRSKLRPVIGKILDSQLKKPVQKAVVKVFTNENESMSTITDGTGIVNFDLPSGIYKMLASAEGYLMLTKDPNGLKVVKVRKDGFIDEDVLLEKDVTKPSADSNASLMNPFG